MEYQGFDHNNPDPWKINAYLYSKSQGYLYLDFKGLHKHEDVMDFRSFVLDKGARDNIANDIITRRIREKVLTKD